MKIDYPTVIFIILCASLILLIVKLTQYSRETSRRMVFSLYPTSRADADGFNKYIDIDGEFYEGYELRDIISKSIEENPTIRRQIDSIKNGEILKVYVCLDPGDRDFERFLETMRRLCHVYSLREIEMQFLLLVEKGDETHPEILALKHFTSGIIEPIQNYRRIDE